MLVHNRTKSHIKTHPNPVIHDSGKKLTDQLHPNFKDLLVTAKEDPIESELLMKSMTGEDAW